MAKSGNSGSRSSSKGGGAKSPSSNPCNKSGTSGGDRGPSSHPGEGGNWPSTTGNPSGDGRGNGPSKG